MLSACASMCAAVESTRSSPPAVVATEPASCAVWAENGECSKNPEFMERRCASACAEAERRREAAADATTVGVEQAEATSYHASEAECNGWAAHGECERNKAWMLKACTAACYRIASGLPVAESPPKASVSAASCERWAGVGECERNPTWMQQECAAACERGRPSQNITQAQCDSWAMCGECKRNAAWMGLECPVACARLSAGRPLVTQNVSSATCISWARHGEFERNNAFMRAACAVACDHLRNGTLPEPEGVTAASCRRWALSGECSANRNFMRSMASCRAACNALEEAEGSLGCDGWADLGQCDLCDHCAYNRSFMRTACAVACARVEQRPACSAAACSGTTALDAPQLDGDGVALAPPLDARAFWLVASLQMPVVEMWLRNGGAELVRMFFVDHEQREFAYCVLMPGMPVRALTEPGAAPCRQLCSAVSRQPCREPSAVPPRTPCGPYHARTRD